MNGDFAKTLLTGIITLLVAAVTGFIAGHFSIQQQTALEREKFQLKLLADEINGEVDEKSRAEVLKFLLDSGVLNALNEEGLEKYAKVPEVADPVTGRLKLPQLTAIADTGSVPPVPAINLGSLPAPLSPDCSAWESSRHLQSESAQLDGFDISRFNNEIVWKDIPDNQAFVFAKATQGATRVDDQFIEFWQQAKNERLIRGAYHYFKAGVAAEAQAENFLKLLLGAGYGECDMPPVLDIEETPDGDQTAFWAGVRGWLTAVEEKTGRRPIIYTTRRANAPAFAARYPLWVPRYNEAAGPGPLSPWSAWTFWQFTDRGKLAGLGEGNLDHFNGDVKALLALTAPSKNSGD